MSRSQQAERAYAQLRALDVSVAERAELALASVSSRRIATLYPETPIQSLAPYLMAHLDSVLASQLDENAGYCSHRLRVLVGSVPTKTVNTWRTHQSGNSFPELVDEYGQSQLRDYFSERLEEEKHEPYSQVNMRSQGRALHSSVVWALWAMSVKDDMPRNFQKAAEKLMLAVAAAFNLE